MVVTYGLLHPGTGLSVRGETDLKGDDQIERADIPRSQEKVGLRNLHKSKESSHYKQTREGDVTGGHQEILERLFGCPNCDQVAVRCTVHLILPSRG